MKKRILISVLLLAFLFGILFGGIFLLRKNANEKEKIKSEEQTVELEKKTEKKEEQRKMDFVNVNLLEPYFSAEEIKSMEQQAEKLLKQDELFASVTTLICTMQFMKHKIRSASILHWVMEVLCLRPIKKKTIAFSSGQKRRKILNRRSQNG